MEIARSFFFVLYLILSVHHLLYSHLSCILYIFILPYADAHISYMQQWDFNMKVIWFFTWFLFSLSTSAIIVDKSSMMVFFVTVSSISRSAVPQSWLPQTCQEADCQAGKIYAAPQMIKCKTSDLTLFSYIIQLDTLAVVMNPFL